MGRPIDYQAAADLLSQVFATAETDFAQDAPVSVPRKAADAAVILFGSKTQAFREALLGCALAHVLDPFIDIRLPYVNQGANAFNGRTLDERVVNPFLQNKAIPCSKGRKAYQLRSRLPGTI